MHQARDKVHAGMTFNQRHGGEHMKWPVNPRMGLLAVASILAASVTLVNARQQNGAPTPIVADYISGVVTSSKGPEAGVWVIAETTDLPTKFAKIVVTNDEGR